MTPLPVKLQRLAKEDLRDAHLWYETQTAGLGADFVNEVLQALRKAAAQPTIYPMIDREHQARPVIVKRFPYKAFFTVEPNRIVVHAVIHAGRSTQAWSKRLT